LLRRKKSPPRQFKVMRAAHLTVSAVVRAGFGLQGIVDAEALAESAGGNGAEYEISGFHKQEGLIRPQVTENNAFLSP
jgi:hypothetical protein